MKFEYVVNTISGYQPIGQLKAEHEIRIQIEANNRVTAERMMRSLFEGNKNVKSYDGICIE